MYQLERNTSQYNKNCHISNIVDSVAYQYEMQSGILGLAQSGVINRGRNVNQAYQDFCNIISKAAKKSIPRGRRNNYIPCWDAECEDLYQTFLQSSDEDQSSRAATALLSRLDKKRRDRWSEAVQNIDFSHSSRKAWSIINNLTGRSRHGPRHCPVSANSIASQLIRNGKYEDIHRESSRLISQEVSDSWRAPTLSPVNHSGDFSPRKFAAVLQQLKPSKRRALILFARSS